jgi:ABC-type multidrug transport system fused ATPase/permease subunit
LDEATSAIDHETDQLVQETIRVAFADCTTLTIAHRLDTILQSSRVMVLGNGFIEEFDSPNVLRSDPSSAFSSILASSTIGSSSANNGSNDASSTGDGAVNEAKEAKA